MTLSTKLPNYLIIGSMRCGTTYIAKVLRSHPEAFMPADKELHFFDRDYDKGIEFYQSYFPANETKRFKAIGEATPAYLYFPDIPERIHRYLPDAKLIISLRNPIDVAYSAYWKAYSTDERTRKMSFEEKLEQEPRLISGGHYAEQIERYSDLYQRDKLHIIIYEELIANPVPEFRRLYQFLGIDENYISPYLNQRINSSGMKNGRSRLLFYLHWLFFRYLEIPSIAGWIEKINTRPIKPISQITRARLKVEFKPANTRLEQLLGKDLSFWD